MTLSERDELHGLPTFLHEWAGVYEDRNDLRASLSSFIENWQILGGISIEKVTEPPEIEPLKLQNFFTSITPLIAEVRFERKKGNSANIWEVSGIKRDEVRVSSVLAWFLNFHGEHGQECNLLSGLLRFIKNKPENFPSAEIVSSSPYWINIESCPSGDKGSRVDIEIEGDKFLLFIEVKIDACETNNQLDRYIEIGEIKSGNRPWGVIFLTPNGCKPKISTNAKENSRLVCISWEEISKVFIEHARSLPQCFSQSVIYQFAKYISNF